MSKYEGPTQNWIVSGNSLGIWDWSRGEVADEGVATLLNREGFEPRTFN